MSITDRLRGRKQEVYGGDVPYHEHLAGDITGGVFSGIVLGGDLRSSNWGSGGGAIPADLTSAEDTGATTGFYGDHSSGSWQMMGSLYVGGNVALIGSGVIKSATTGRRIEMGVTPDTFSDPHLEWYTAHAMEDEAGYVRMYVEDDAGVGFLDVGAFAEIRTPTIDFGSSVPTVFTAFQLWSEQDNDALQAGAKVIASADSHTGAPLFQFDRPAAGSAAPWQLGLNAGTVGAPGLSFFDAVDGMSDLNTGIRWVSDGRFALVSNGADILDTLYLGVWQTYTPTFSASGGGAEGNATMVGRWVRLGETVIVMIKMIWGSTTNSGTGNMRWALPVAARSIAEGFGSGQLVNAATEVWTVTSFIDTSDTSKVGLYHIDNGAATTQSVLQGTPLTFGTGDIVQFTTIYEAA